MKVQHALRKFRGMSDIRKLMCEVIGFALLPDQITELRKEFEKLDVEQNGEISLDNLKKVLMANAAGSGSYYFTEDEVEDIFNSMRLHKKSTTIHWHHRPIIDLLQKLLHLHTIQQLLVRLLFQPDSGHVFQYLQQILQLHPVD